MNKILKYLDIIKPLCVAVLIPIAVGAIGGLFYVLTNVVYEMIMENKMLINDSPEFRYYEIFNSILVIATRIVRIIIFTYWFIRLKSMKEVVKDCKSLSLNKLVIVLGIAIGCRLFMLGLTNLIFHNFQSLIKSHNTLINSLSEGNKIVTLIYIIIIVPITEELIFRGVVLTKAQKVCSFIVANLLQAILFSIYHMNIIQGFYAFISGLLLGYIAYKYKSIIMPILLNMLLNIIGYFNIVFYVSTISYIIYTIVGLMILIYTLKIIKKINNS